MGLAAPRHRSRQATAADLRHAALVIALAPEHVHWVRRTHPDAAPAHGHPPAPGARPAGDDAPLPERVASLDLADVELGDWEEVVDPGGGDAEVFAACAAEVVDLVAALRPEAGGPMTAAPHRRRGGRPRSAPVDALGMPLGPGPAARLPRGPRPAHRLGGPAHHAARCSRVLSDLFTHPNVHYLSGFYGPLERLLRDSGANIGFAPADFRRFVPILSAWPRG